MQSLQVHGWVSLTLVNNTTGEVEEKHRSSNLIMNVGLTIMSQLLAQVSATPTLDKITTIRIGDSTLLPEVAQTDIQGALQANVTISTATEDEGSVPGLIRFTAIHPSGGGTAATIRELALITANGDMYARQLTPILNKSTAQTLTVDWRIQFSLS